MRYSTVPIPERIGIRDKFNVWGNKTNSFVRPFQNAYQDVIQWATDLTRDQRVAHIEDYDERRRAEYQLAPVVYGFGNDALQIYILRGGISIPGHDMGDAAVLHLKNEPHSHVVLYGEAGKKWLDRGVADFVIPAQDIGQELKDIMAAWADFSTENLDLSSSDSERATAQRLSDMMTLHDPVDFIHTYLYPITQLSFDSPEMYHKKISAMLLKSPPVVEQAAIDSPLPFAKIRAFE